MELKKRIRNILLEEYNNSIHNWELHHSVRKTKTEISKELRFVNEMKDLRLEKHFENFMKEYNFLYEVEREYDIWETGEVYTAYVYYKDPEIDWEDDEFVFKIFPVDNSDDYNLEYNAWELKTISSAFGKELFEKMLRPWFEKTYRFKVNAVYPV